MVLVAGWCVLVVGWLVGRCVLEAGCLAGRCVLVAGWCGTSGGVVWY